MLRSKVSQTHRLLRLKQKLLALRARLDSAEGMLAIMRHEMQAIKGALDPWYHPDPVLESSPLSPQSQSFLQPPSYSLSSPSSTTAPAYRWHGHHGPPADVMVHLPISPGKDPSISTTLDSVSHTAHGLHGDIATFRSRSLLLATLRGRF